ncbi:MULTISPECIES: hypothetical protein [Photorhabdus]|nr:hypothetical protein [Photorhabdus asymbiotica]
MNLIFYILNRLRGDKRANPQFNVTGVSESSQQSSNLKDAGYIAEKIKL